jgi:hypothetical protein
VITNGVQPILHIEYKSPHVKQLLQRAPRAPDRNRHPNPNDFLITKGVDKLPSLCALGRQNNRKVRGVERVSLQCVLTQHALDRLQLPSLETGQRVSALRFGEPARRGIVPRPHRADPSAARFRNRDLRCQLEALLGRAYTAAQMIYDLRRLRLKA